MRRVLTAAAILVAFAVPVAAHAQTATVSEQDKTFLTGQQQTNLAEISLGKIVMEKATSEKVRALAKDLVAGHEAVSQENMALSQKLGVTPPTEPSAEQKATAEKVTAQSGAAFDLAYVAAQVEGHTKSLAKANTEITSGTNPDVKAFATAYLPKAQSHLDMSRAVQAELGATQPAPAAGGLPRTGRSTAALAGFGLAALLLGLSALRLSHRPATARR